MDFELIAICLIAMYIGYKAPQREKETEKIERELKEKNEKEKYLRYENKNSNDLFTGLLLGFFIFS